MPPAATMSFIQAIVLSAMQGATELFPFSSLGLQVIVPRLLHWHIAQSGAQFLPFVVSLHVGTAAGLIVLFFREWWALAAAGWRSLRTGFREVGRDPEQKTLWLLVAATVPAGLAGLLLRHPLARLFAAPELAAAFLIVNGAAMALGDRLLRPRPEGIPQMRFGQAAGIGLSQALALIPGISRSGVTMVTGLAAGLGYETAARFSFLMATPIILAAGALELHKLHGGAHGLAAQAAVGFVVAAVVAYLSARYLLHYFRTRRLLPFSVISAAAGAVFLVLLRLHA